MDKTPACSIFLGLLIGVIFGFAVGALSGDPVHVMQLGAMVGLFIGWFIAVNPLEKRN